MVQSEPMGYSRSVSRITVLASGVILFTVLGLCAESFAGSVKTVSGAPVVVRGTELIPAKAGMRLQPKDALRTDAQSKIGVILRDGTRVSLGPESEVTIESFLFEPGKGELNLLLRMVRGVAAFVSGKIAALAPEAAKVETPVGMIGLRGTKFAVSLAAR